MDLKNIHFPPAIIICLLTSFSLFAYSSTKIPSLKVRKKTLYKNTAQNKHVHNTTTNLVKTQLNCSDINWATWGSFAGESALGTISNIDGSIVNVTMTSNFAFSSTLAIYNYSKFNGYPSPIPNSQVPETTWSKGFGGVTTMCFAKTVTNPVLLLASLGNSAGVSSKLDFSIPYVVLYDGGGMVYNSSNSLTGTEGYAIIMFPGDFNCVTINSITEEFYTNITWGLRPPPFPISINENANSCASSTLTASGGVSYLWNGGDTPNNATNTFHQSGTYIVTVTNAAGCTTSTSKTVTVNEAIPPPVISGNSSACGSVTLSATGGVSYLWDGGDTPTNATNTFHQSGTYTVTTTVAGGCTTSASAAVIVNSSPSPAIAGNAIDCGSLTLTASGGTSYLWDGGDTPTGATNTFHQSGTYNVKVTNAAGCSALASKTITVNAAIPPPVISGSTNSCGSVTLSASGGVSYSWNGGDTPNNAINTFHQSGTYTVTATAASGCTTSASSAVLVDSPPAPTISGNTTGCGSVTLTASGGVSYLWDGGNTPNNATNTFSTGGTYHVMVSNANNCMGTATAIVTIGNSITPSVNITDSPSTIICLGTPVSFTASPVNGGTAPLYEWYKNNVAVASGPVYVTNNVADGDVLQCQLTSNLTCAIPITVSSNVISMKVNPIPIISIDQNIVINGSTKTKLNPLIKGDIQTYLWTPSTGLDDPTSPNPVASPQFTTNYTLTVTSTAGCEANASLTVTVLKNDIIIPNTFTPNNDGINDTWDIAYLSDYKDATIDIYNRWGQHLFHSVGYTKAWDGLYNGKRLTAGAYYYVIDLKYSNYGRRAGWVAILF